MPAVRFGVLAPYNVSGLCLSLLACAANAAGGGLNADHKNFGDGRNKSPFLLCRGNAALYGNPRGEGIALGT